MRVLLSTDGSRGNVDPPAGLAVRWGELGAEVRVCVPRDGDGDFAELSAGVGVPPVPPAPCGRPVYGTVPLSVGDVPRHAAALIAAQFDPVAPTAEGCAARVAA